MPKKIPYGALRLVEVGKDCHALAEEVDGKKKLKMTVYSGGVIKGHWWWGDLLVDLTGMQFTKKKYPVLENHRQDLKIGFTGKPIVDGSIVLDPEKTEFVSTEESKKFQETSAEGFPYQASMYAIPTSVERIRDGEKAEANGLTIKGPATIWRKSIFQEASVCVFGWDKQTEASVFSKEKMTELEFEETGGDAEGFTHVSGFDKVDKNKGEVKEMPKTVAELQEKYSDLTTELVNKVTADLTTKFEEEKGVLDTKIIQLSEENVKKEDRLAGLEKKDMIRSEKELKTDAEKIVTTKLMASELPERLYPKIRGLLKHDKFVKDDVLDTKAFAEFVDKEIKEFEDIGITNTVLGLGSSQRDEGDATPDQEKELKLDKEDDEAVDAMFKMAGGTVPEKTGSAQE